jgi:hypothetical protein
MHRARSLLTLLLAAALAMTQGLRSDAGACAPGSDGSQVAIVDLHAGSGAAQSCGTHHPGGGSTPGGMRHCAASLDCAAGPALAEASVRRPEPRSVVAAGLPAVVLPPTDSPEPLAPPPRS